MVINAAHTHGPLTVRQLFYRLVAAGSTDKTEAAYRALKKMVKAVREAGDLDWSLILDNVRTTYGQARYTSPEAAVDALAREYRRDLMADQDVVVQVWAESDSVASIIWDAVDGYGIRTWVGRGYSSRGFVWDATEAIADADLTGKRIAILHVGDHDPSGEDIYRDLTDTLRLYAAARINGLTVDDVRCRPALVDAVPVTFQRVAVLPEHETAHGLLTAPPKAKDPRIGRFTGTGTIEAEAFTTIQLRTLVTNAIEAHIDMAALAGAEAIEEADRQALDTLADRGIAA
jgi:hypothetical protein